LSELSNMILIAIEWLYKTRQRLMKHRKLSFICMVEMLE